jgi:DNA-binding NtrC family response regulator
MNPAVLLNDRAKTSLARGAAVNREKIAGRPTLLVAAVGPEIRNSLSGLLGSLSLSTIWAHGVEDVKRVLARERVAACLCGFWLQDGTYRELIRHIRREQINVAVILVSAPECPQEYRDYLAGLNIGALDFLCYPYRHEDLEAMLESAIGGYAGTARPGIVPQVDHHGDTLAALKAV